MFFLGNTQITCVRRVTRVKNLAKNFMLGLEANDGSSHDDALGLHFARNSRIYLKACLLHVCRKLARNASQKATTPNIKFLPFLGRARLQAGPPVQWTPGRPRVVV